VRTPTTKRPDVRRAEHEEGAAWCCGRACTHRRPFPSTKDITFYVHDSDGQWFLATRWRGANT
jgi:hypothetical protein